MTDQRGEISQLIAGLVESVGDSGDALWQALQELELTTVAIDEDCGGSGGDLADLAVIVEELAARGPDTPIVEYNVGHWACSGAEDGPITVACVDQKDPSNPVAVAWPQRASHLVLINDIDQQSMLVPLGTPTGSEQDSLDEQVSYLDLDLAGAMVLEIGPGTEDIVARLAILRSAALLGALREAYRLTRHYVCSREQFGRPLIQIPSVATAVSGIKVEVIQAATALERALEAPTLARAATARVIAAGSAGTVARAAHQLHGAMGITHEYPLHRSTRRLWAWRDRDLSESAWARMLAHRADEPTMWDSLTAPGPIEVAVDA